MGWYKLIFKQKQPIHIGKFEWGVVSETEIFIPGWTMWGALTNAYIIKNKVSSKESIEKIQEAFEIITNFFPSFDGKEILEPSYTNGEFYLGEYSEEEFRFHFIYADFKAAVEPILKKAKDKHLHEFEYILPCSKEEREKNLYWIGLIKLEEKEYVNFLNENLIIFVGGDVKYGFGKLKLEKMPEEIDDNTELKKWNIGRNDNFAIGDNGELRNFLQFFKSNLEFDGKIKLLPEFKFTQGIPLVTDVGFFITPGSLIKGNISEKDLILKKGKFQQVKGKDV